MLFGVVHHIPGREHRAALLTRFARHLAPGGMIAYTVWRFDRFERFTQKLVPWDEFLASGHSLELDKLDGLEPGDHIMTWGDSEPAYRYCHAMTDEEAETLERSLPLESLPSFSGDDDLNGYYVLMPLMPLMKETPLDAREPAQRERSFPTRVAGRAPPPRDPTHRSCWRYRSRRGYRPSRRSTREPSRCEGSLAGRHRRIGPSVPSRIPERTARLPTGIVPNAFFRRDYELTERFLIVREEPVFQSRRMGKRQRRRVSPAQ